MENESNEKEPSLDDRFSEFMFGSRRNFDGNEHQDRGENNQSYINYNELFTHIDTLMESTRNLKPLFQKVYPYIQKIISKI